MEHNGQPIGEVAVDDMRSVSEPNNKRKRPAATSAAAGDSLPGSAQYVVNDDAEASEDGDDEVEGGRPAKKQRATSRKTNSNAEDSKADKQKGPPAKKYTDAEIEAFYKGVTGITDWTSKQVHAKYIQLARWYDLDGIPMMDCCTNWVTHGYANKKRLGGKTAISEAAVFRMYNQFVRHFYQEKGIAFISLVARRYYKKKGVVKAEVPSGKPLGPSGPLKTPGLPGALPDDTDLSIMSAHGTTDTTGLQERAEPDTRDPAPSVEEQQDILLSSEDERLIRLLSNQRSLIRPSQLLFDFEKRRKGPSQRSPISETEVGDEDAEVKRFKIHRASSDILSFKRKNGDTRRGHPSRIILSRALAVQYSTFVRDALNQDKSIDTIEYTAEMNESTISRFIACISPTLRSSLPTQDMVELSNEGLTKFRCTQIQWSMQELEDLYLLAQRMGSPDVCDMIIDRIHKELHQQIPRLLHTEDGTTKRFNILGFSTAFREYLSEHDTQGCRFFTDILIMKSDTAFGLLNAFGLESWDVNMKEALMDRLEFGVMPMVGKQDAADICAEYHHHSSYEECYRTQAHSAPSTFDNFLHDNTVNACAQPKKHKEASRRIASRATEEQKKRWSRQRAFQGKVRIAKQRQKNDSLASRKAHAEMLMQRRLQELYNDRDGDYVDSSDSEHSSDDEDSNAVSLGLNHEYNVTRAHDQTYDHEIPLPY